MRIVAFDRSNSKSFNGGDTVQIKAIAAFLRSKGYDVDIFSAPLDISSYDLVFIFNLQKPYEALIYANLAALFKKPYIIFPIYWDMNSLGMKDVFSMRNIIKNVVPPPLLSLVKGLKFFKENRQLFQKYSISSGTVYSLERTIQYLLNNALFIIPNSQAEALHLQDKFGGHYAHKVRVIYNGSDIDLSDKEENELDVFEGIPESFVCCIGGIGPRKNQISLIEAVKDTDINLVIIGKASESDREYERRIKEIASNNVYFIGELSVEGIRYVLKKSKGHIQPSYIETPGISSIEALLLNCPICVSDVAPVREYFCDNAIYCSPYDIESIRDGILQLYKGNGKVEINRELYHWNYVLNPLYEILKAEVE
ncbi:glycosyltransferase [Paenibacillus silagei]|uniref:Glycosyltransferase involved in cell wall biosynthesis n=1 Tax=Paenibacillus silagei TaxID=1670801 RepID=A0ABS4NKC4_9BACL|nr:glycosyltransferase [Paenibacillus silagei]MBP2109884.1 glycosyltransferase involved in cell wall biosynthesis [Paenibacillus silagei]